MRKVAKSSSKVTLSREDKVLDLVISLLMVILCIVILYPLIYVVSSSFSSGSAVTTGKVLLWPVDFSLTGYEIVFGYKQVWTGYWNTIIYTVGGTAINIVLTVMAAYPLSRRNLQGKKYYMVFFLIPMFFSGGIIPSYILMTNLHLTNTRWAILLASGLSVYNMIIMRTFFQNSIPEDMLEAAKIDGISDVGYLFKIVLPLSKAIFAVIIMYYAVYHWNSYFNAMLYLRDRDLQPLQIILRDILNVSNIDLSQIRDAELLAKMQGAADVMKYSLIVVSTVPVLVIYPFVQKYFEKGVMIGSVKG